MTSYLQPKTSAVAIYDTLKKWRYGDVELAPPISQWVKIVLPKISLPRSSRLNEKVTVGPIVIDLDELESPSYVIDDDIVDHLHDSLGDHDHRLFLALARRGFRQALQRSRSHRKPQPLYAKSVSAARKEIHAALVGKQSSQPFFGCPAFREIRDLAENVNCPTRQTKKQNFSQTRHAIREIWCRYMAFHFYAAFSQVYAFRGVDICFPEDIHLATLLHMNELRLINLWMMPNAYIPKENAQQTIRLIQTILRGWSTYRFVKCRYGEIKPILRDLAFDPWTILVLGSLTYPHASVKAQRDGVIYASRMDVIASDLSKLEGARISKAQFLRRMAVHKKSSQRRRTSQSSSDPWPF